MTPANWTGAGVLVVNLNGNAAWGYLSSKVGNYSLGLQYRLTAIEQTVTGLKKHREYELSFLVAARPRHGDSEKLSVYVNDKEVFAYNEPVESFRRETVIVEASSEGVIRLMFQNRSPGDGDHTVFVDDVQLHTQRDCGEEPHAVLIMKTIQIINVLVSRKNRKD
eukprot:m.2660 g.2660  ORF g.2660 m.2660 type:complete len:165 (-) comp2563_c0_seq2:128-622(-)